MIDQRPRNRDTLLFPARKLGRKVVAPRREADHVDGLVDRHRVVGDIGHQRHAELHGGTVCTRLAAAVGDGPSAIGVVQNIDALGIAGVGRQIRTAFTIVAEGRITNTAFVGDASQGMREAAVLVVIELACVVRIVDVFQITGGVVAVAPAAARVIGDAGDAVIGVVTKDQILTCVGVDAFQPTLDVVAQGLGAAM